MFNLDFLRLSSLMGTTLRAVPRKGQAFSTNDHTCIAMPTWHRCAPPIWFWHWPPYNLLQKLCFTWIFFVGPHWWVQLCVQHPAKAMPFQQIIMHALQCQHDLDVHILFCFDHDLNITSLLMGTPLRAAPSKIHAFSTNYQACIAMPTWHRCDLLFCFDLDLHITSSRGRV